MVNYPVFTRIFMNVATVDNMSEMFITYIP